MFTAPRECDDALRTMRVLHYVLALASAYGLIVGLQMLDRRLFQSAGVRARGWNAATWGASVFWLGELSLLGWFWVTRFRFDPLFRTARRARVGSKSDVLSALLVVFIPRGPSAVVRRVVRGVLAVSCAILALALVACAETLLELAIFDHVLGLPPYKR